jgi:hypothetical protein
VSISFVPYANLSAFLGLSGGGGRLVILHLRTRDRA